MIAYTDEFTLPSGVVFTWQERKDLGIEHLTYKQMCELSDKIMEKYYPKKTT